MVFSTRSSSERKPRVSMDVACRQCGDASARQLQRAAAACRVLRARGDNQHRLSAMQVVRGPKHAPGSAPRGPWRPAPGRWCA